MTGRPEGRIIKPTTCREGLTQLVKLSWGEGGGGGGGEEEEEEEEEEVEEEEEEEEDSVVEGDSFGA